MGELPTRRTKLRKKKRENWGKMGENKRRMRKKWGNIPLLPARGGKSGYATDYRDLDLIRACFIVTSKLSFILLSRAYVQLCTVMSFKDHNRPTLWWPSMKTHYMDILDLPFYYKQVYYVTPICHSFTIRVSWYSFKIFMLDVHKRLFMKISTSSFI